MEVISTITLPTVIILEPSKLDAYAVIGAVVGAGYAVYRCRAKDKDFTFIASVWAISMFFGCVFPGGAYNFCRWMGVIPASLSDYISWHMWAIFGFCFSTSGWWLAAKIQRTFRSNAEKVFKGKGISRSSLYHERR